MSQGIRADLERGIRRWDLVALGINLVVGVGIFDLPSQAFALSGPASLLAFGVCSVAISLIALCFAEVSSRYASTGGVYFYARDAYGGFTGFQVGWLRWVSGVSAWAAQFTLDGLLSCLVRPGIGIGRVAGGDRCCICTDAHRGQSAWRERRDRAQ